jgi:hypothetical protein
MFKVMGYTNINASTFKPTYHVSERQSRLALCEVLGGQPIKSIIVDKGHENGLEIHTVTSQGIVYIGNATTQKLVTFLIARPEQLKRYGVYDDTVLAIARKHQELGYNNM